MTATGAAVSPPAAALTPAVRRRVQRGWYFYDWANSAFSTTVVTVFLGPYLTDVAQRAAGTDGFLHPLGIPVRAGSYFPYLVSLSVLLSVFVLPVTGAIADRTGRKPAALGVTAYAGALATMALYLVGGDAYLLGGALFVLANIAFGASIVVYNSFLPDIATPEERDAVSSRGWALGYLGGGLLLVANLVLFQAHDRFGVSTEHAVRISLLSAGAWWAVFTVLPLAALTGLGRRAATGPAAGTVLGAGLRQLADTLQEARRYPRTLLFLGAFLLFNEGVQTVISQSAVYGSEELRLGQGTLVSAILLVQFLAFGGALLLGLMARVLGARPTILASLVLWTLALGIAYLLPPGQALLFFGLAALIGLVLGGTQALSRSLYSQMIPRGREAEYFSLYEVGDRGTSWLGPLLFGLTFQVTGSYRASIVILVVFFAAGFAVLARTPVREAIIQAGNAPPARV